MRQSHIITFLYCPNFERFARKFPRLGGLPLFLSPMKETFQTTIDRFLFYLPYQKLIERVMHTQLLEYFQAGNLLTDSQSGFRPNHSTCTALISAVNLWLTNMNAGKRNGSVFIDLKKAFDTVDHDILLRKLSCYGVNGNAGVQLLKSYLIDRTQRSYVNGVLSTEQYVSCSIPQGSILGPFFFTIYVNDFPKCLQHTTPWYVCR